jgi:cation:H+ antiporter
LLGLLSLQSVVFFIVKLPPYRYTSAMHFEMNLFWAPVFLATGLFILIKGADLLVDGAVALAKAFGVSPLIIGLTIISMGTSAPEVATSITATARNLGNTAIGNVYGSNIANLALVGGLCAIVLPISVKLSVLRKELPAMLIVALLLWPILAADMYLTRSDGVILLAVFAVLLTLTIIAAAKQAKVNGLQTEQLDSESSGQSYSEKRLILKNSIFMLIGLAALALGANLAVEGAVFIGNLAGLSETVIGLTIIAIGTSLPELVTCLVAAFKGHSDVSIGTLVGSNIFNALLAIGCAGLIHPFAVTPRLVGTDYWIMVIVTAVFVVMATAAKKINRPCGLILTAGYIAYIIYLLVFTKSIA